MLIHNRKYCKNIILNIRSLSRADFSFLSENSLKQNITKPTELLKAHKKEVYIAFASGKQQNVAFSMSTIYYTSIPLQFLLPFSLLRQKVLLSNKKRTYRN